MLKKVLFVFVSLALFGCAGTMNFPLSATIPISADATQPVNRIGPKVYVISASDLERVSAIRVNKGSNSEYEGRLFNRIYTSIERELINRGVTPLSTLTATSQIARYTYGEKQPDNAFGDANHILVIREIQIDWSNQPILLVTGGGGGCMKRNIFPLIGKLDAQLLDTEGKTLWSGFVNYRSSDDLNTGAYVLRNGCTFPSIVNANVPLCIGDTDANSCKSGATVREEDYDKIAKKLVTMMFKALTYN